MGHAFAYRGLVSVNLPWKIEKSYGDRSLSSEPTPPNDARTPFRPTNLHA